MAIANLMFIHYCLPILFVSLRYILYSTAKGIFRQQVPTPVPAHVYAEPSSRIRIRVRSVSISNLDVHVQVLDVPVQLVSVLGIRSLGGLFNMQSIQKEEDIDKRK